MVDVRSTSVEPQTPSDERDSLLDRVRRIPDRVGGGVPGPEDRRSMVPAGESMAYQLPGTVGGRSCSEDVPEGQVETGQHNSSVPMVEACVSVMGDVKHQLFHNWCSSKNNWL